MRERLAVALVALTLGVVTVLLVERAYATAALIQAAEQREVQRSADLLATLLGETQAPVTSRLLEDVLNAGEHVEYVAADGTRVEWAVHEDEADDHSDQDVVVTQPVDGGGTLTFTRHEEVVADRVADALLPLVLVGLGLLAVAGLAAVLIAGWLSRPFRELAATAEHIGRGDFDVRVPRYAVPEADAVGRALRVSAEDLDTLVRRERDFAAHASHQLRTPITALRLELEDLALAPQTPPEVVPALSGALGQLDRLSDNVAAVLDASRGSRFGVVSDLDLAALVRDTVQRWRGLAPRRALVDQCDGPVAVHLPAGSLMQLMDLLIGNAVTDGSGTVTVSVRRHNSYAEVLVADRGAGEVAGAGARSPLARGTAGLATAMETAEALGGQLRLAEAEHTTFSLVLPLSRRETVEQ
jgi:signal transduction histidine kinase